MLNYPAIRLETITGEVIKVVKAIHVQLSVRSVLLNSPVILLVIDRLLKLNTILLGMDFINQQVGCIDFIGKSVSLRQYPQPSIPFVEEDTISSDSTLPSSSSTHTDSHISSDTDHHMSISPDTEKVMMVQLSVR